MKPGIRFGYMYAEFMLNEIRDDYSLLVQQRTDADTLSKEEQEWEERLFDAWERAYDALSDAECAEEERIRHQTWTDECNETSLRLN